MIRYSFILLLLFGCKKYDQLHTYTILQGNHRSTTKISSVKAREVYFKFRFTKDHEFETDHYNKLYGLTSLKIHRNSARIGYRYKNERFEVVAYYYINGVRSTEPLYEAKVNEDLEFAVMAGFGEYSFYCNGEQIVIYETKEFKTWRTYPYFGGESVAPWDMCFAITEL